MVNMSCAWCNMLNFWLRQKTIIVPFPVYTCPRYRPFWISRLVNIVTIAVEWSSVRLNIFVLHKLFLYMPKDLLHKIVNNHVVKIQHHQYDYHLWPHSKTVNALFWCPTHIVLFCFVLFVFVLCLAYPILLVLWIVYFCLSLWYSPTFIYYKWTLLVSYVPHQLQRKTDWIEKLCNSMSTSTYSVSWAISENYFSFMICL